MGGGEEERREKETEREGSTARRCGSHCFVISSMANDAPPEMRGRGGRLSRLSLLSPDSLSVLPQTRPCAWPTGAAAARAGLRSATRTCGARCATTTGTSGTPVSCAACWAAAGLAAPGRGRFGPGSGPILLDDVRCAGTEDALGRCGHSGWGRHNCRHGEDAGVICAGVSPGSVPLALAALLRSRDSA